MKQVVIVAPSFAPASNPPTQRVRFFAAHLPELGWRPTVLSVDPRYYEESLDPEIDALLPPGLEVIRTPAWPAAITRRIGIGDLGIRAYWPMRRALERMRPDLVFIPGPPWHTFLLGAMMRDAYDIPYVLDYIDPWVSSAGAGGRWWSKAFWYRQVALALEPRAVRGAAHITAVSDGTNEGVRARYPWLPADRCTGIPYGIEPADFEALRQRPRAQGLWPAGDGNVHLVSVGAMLPNGYETLRALFSALRLLGPTRLRLHFVGTTYEPVPRTPLVEPVAREMGVGDIVTEHPARVPYLDALNLLVSADGILALGSTESHYTASKIFPSIFARRPLLAIYHEASSVCDVVRRSRGGTLVTYSDTERADARVGAIADALRGMNTYDAAAVQWDVFEAYTARRMTERLAAVFDRCVSS
jgi:hypothetical protein